MTAGIQITGATFTGGSIISGVQAPSATVVIQPWYITNEGQFGPHVTSLGSGSWLVSVGATLAENMYFEAATQGTLAEWTTKFATAGFNTDYSYAWNATWASGQTTVVRMAIGSVGTDTGDPNLMKVIPVDTTITGWETSNPFTTSAGAPGVYSLPVTFTPYVPTTQMTNSWI
jgi:hypothetical protein